MKAYFFEYALNYLCFVFTSSPIIAPAMIAKAPMLCNKDMCSCNKTVANTTADRGSRYPQIATVCTGSFDNGEKYR